MSREPLAFYAPLKPPQHPNPSGDRHLARLLMHALDLAGFDVELAAGFRSRDGQGDRQRQRRLQRIGHRWAQRLIRHYLRRPLEQRPRIWFTYHLYHKAPDWLGPPVSQALKIPYVVAEASYAPKQEGGPWNIGVNASREALQQAAAVLCLNPQDQACLKPWVATERLHRLSPFIDLQRYDALPGVERDLIARQHQLDPSKHWLTCVAMMRPGDKSHSYRLLAQALKQTGSTNWQLLVIGDGQASAQVKAQFSGLDNVRFLGRLPSESVYPLLKASDLFLWPAVNEAFGLAFLEAQAAGTAVLAGDEGGVSSILATDGAVLTPARDTQAFRLALEQLLANPGRLTQMGLKARQYLQTHHALPQAAERLNHLLRPLL